MRENTHNRARTNTFALVFLTVAASLPAAADSFFFSTENPDGKIAMLSRPASPGQVETETADDFVLNQTTTTISIINSPLSTAPGFDLYDQD